MDAVWRHNLFIALAMPGAGFEDFKLELQKMERTGEKADSEHSQY